MYLCLSSVFVCSVLLPLLRMRELTAKKKGKKIESRNEMQNRLSSPAGETHSCPAPPKQPPLFVDSVLVETK